MTNKNNTINCSNEKSDKIALKDGDFKFIKNFDPANNQLANLLDLWDKIDFQTHEGYKASWFFDKGTNKMYTFMTDKNDKIVAGAVVEYHKDILRTGILQKDEKNRETTVHQFQGNDIQKEKIKSFIQNKANGSKEELILVSDDILSEAKQAIANADIKNDGGYAITGNSGEKGVNQIG